MIMKEYSTTLTRAPEYFKDFLSTLHGIIQSVYIAENGLVAGAVEYTDWISAEE